MVLKCTVYFGHGTVEHSDERNLTHGIVQELVKDYTGAGKNTTVTVFRSCSLFGACQIMDDLPENHTGNSKQG